MASEGTYFVDFVVHSAELWYGGVLCQSTWVQFMPPKSCSFYAPRKNGIHFVPPTYSIEAPHSWGAFNRLGGCKLKRGEAIEFLPKSRILCSAKFEFYYVQNSSFM